MTPPPSGRSPGPARGLDGPSSGPQPLVVTRAPCPLTPDDLKQFLLARDSPAELIPTKVPTPTVADAARALGVPQDEVVKTLLLNADGRFLLAVAGGRAKVDLDAAARVFAASTARLATAEEVEVQTGFPPGGVPPVGHLLPIPLVMDRTLLYRTQVYAGGGDAHHMLAISPLDILRLTGGVAAPIHK